MVKECIKDGVNRGPLKVVYHRVGRGSIVFIKSPSEARKSSRGLRKALPLRIVDHYTSSLNRNTIEYWQIFIFYTLFMVMAVASLFMLIPNIFYAIRTDAGIMSLLYIFVYISVFAFVFFLGLSIQWKTSIVSILLYGLSIGVTYKYGPISDGSAFLYLIPFLCSLFIGFRSGLLTSIVNFLVGTWFLSMYQRGLFHWDYLVNYSYSLYFISNVNIFVIQLIFAISISQLIRGVQKTFTTINTINASLERFIPREFLSFLRKENILEVELGDWTECKMTVFFLDIRDFTTLSENMSPQDNFRFLNSFLKIFGPIIRAHSGFIDKYPGDGIMALFPGKTDDALFAALDMRDCLVGYNAGRARGGYVPIRFGIGIHTGPLMLGTIGENNRMDSTVISDTVNAASRIESLNKKFATDILLSGESIHGLSGPWAFETRFLAEEMVKGRVRAVQVHQLIGMTASGGTLR